MLDAILGPLGGILAGVVSVALAWVLGRQQGARAEHDKQVRRDYEQADKIRDKADAARAADDAGNDPLGELRRAGRVRND
jgi:hypothetical protein